ncbi:MAG: hypothetical protein M1826_004185 [Phylliscum demangeonii]|nr:MAG: hypothetical protein M1826_004185 [Phylliscum demangeonii]
MAGVPRDASVHDGTPVKAEAHSEQATAQPDDHASTKAADPLNMPGRRNNPCLLWLYYYARGSSDPVLVPRLLDSIRWIEISQVVGQRAPPGQYVKAIYGLLAAPQADANASHPTRIRLLDDEDLRAWIHLVRPINLLAPPNKLHIQVLLHPAYLPLDEPPPGEMPYERGGSSGRNDG